MNSREFLVVSYDAKYTVVATAPGFGAFTLNGAAARPNGITLQLYIELDRGAVTWSTWSSLGGVLASGP